MALQAYRHLWRAAQLAFQGDTPVLLAAQTQIRNEFRQKSQELNPSDTDGIRAAVQHAEDVARILRENVVQGQKVDQKQDSYKLRIHEHTERGDNESIKTAGTQASQGGCGCK